MNLSSYVADAEQRLRVQEGFRRADQALPESLRPYCPAFFVRPDRRGDLFVALFPGDYLGSEGRRFVVDMLADAAAATAAGTERPALVVAVFIFTRRAAALLPAALALGRWDGAAGHGVLPWVVDLESGQVTAHPGPPTLDPQLLRGLDPAAPVPAEAPPPAPAVGVRPAFQPRVTQGLLALVVLIFLAVELSGGSTHVLNMIRWGAAHKPSIWTGEYWRLLTAVFLHWGFGHLLLNGWALFILGGLVERLYGHLRFLFVFVFAGLVGSLLSLMMGDAHTISAGASGGIFGLFGALVYFRLASPLGVHFSWQQLLAPIVINLFFGLLVPAIDNWGHFGGLVGGFAAGLIAGVPRERLAGGRLKGLAAVVVLALLLTGYFQVGAGRWWPAYRQGAAALQTSEPQQALAHMQRAVELGPGQPAAYYGLALSYRELGRRAEAEQALLQALSLDPFFRQAAGELAELQ